MGQDQPAVDGLDGAQALRHRTGEQFVQYTVTLSLLIQVLAFGVFMSAVMDGRAMILADGTAVPHALYTLGTIVTVTYIQMTVFPILRWPLAFPDVAILFLAGIGQIAAARLLFDAGAWWYAILPIHIAAAAAFANVSFRLQAHHFGPAAVSFRRLKAGAPILALLHGAIAGGIWVCAAVMPKTPGWTWVAMEAISVAMVGGLIVQERWLAGLYQELGLRRFGASFAKPE